MNLLITFLSFFKIGIILKIIIPSIVLGIIIYLISKHTGIESSKMLSYLGNCLNILLNYITSCFEYIKSFI